jgi:hypothetical protein
MASWGRHGWPKKDEGLRLYKERDGSYLIIDPESDRGGLDAIANALTGPEPSLSSCTVSRDFTYTRGCKRVQWKELPAKWKKAFKPWLTNKPETIRGFWLVGQQPEPPKKKVKVKT